VAGLDGRGAPLADVRQFRGQHRPPDGLGKGDPVALLEGNVRLPQFGLEGRGDVRSGGPELAIE
jgi:hypothetical protein